MKLFIVMLLLLFSSAWARQEVKVIKNPMPNMEEQNYTRLIKYRELKETGDNAEFLAHIESLTVDNDSNVYAFDPIQGKVFKYDSELKLIRTFAGKGQGPGELTPGGRFTIAELQVRNGIVYLADRMGRKIICFSTEGVFLREIVFRNRQSMELCPVVDQAGNIYLHADIGEQNEHVIDCYDENGHYKKGFLQKANLLTALFSEYEQKRDPEIIRRLPKDVFLPSLYNTSTKSNTLFAINQKNQLLVYSPTSGNFWVFSGAELQISTRLWPRKALHDHKMKCDDALKRGGFYSFFNELIPDLDQDDNFFLDYGLSIEEDKSFLYEFSNQGKLQRVLYVNNPKRRFTSFKAKKNNRYYAITRNDDQNLTITVFKEGKYE